MYLIFWIFLKSILKSTYIFTAKLGKIKFNIEFYKLLKTMKISLLVQPYFCLSMFSRDSDIWYFVTKIFQTYCEKKIVLGIEKNFWNSRLKAENLQNFEITRTIYSNSERSEQFLVTEFFFNLFLKVSHISNIRIIQIQIGKNYWDLETCRKS